MNIMKGLIYLCLSFVAIDAHAEAYVRAQGMYLSSGAGSGSISHTTRTLIDFGGGFIHPQGWTLGFLYATENAVNGTGSPTSNRAAFGPTAGWMTPGEGGGPYALATYFLNSSYDAYKGTGYSIDVGYKIPLGKVGLGVQMTFKHFKFTEMGGATISPTYEQEYIDPYFVMFISI